MNIDALGLSIATGIATLLILALKTLFALARKLAVIMHTMLKTGELFDPQAGDAVAA